MTLCQVAAKSPNGVLRTPNTIHKLKSVPTQPGSQPLLLIYFNEILVDSKLNALETIELARHVIQQGKQVSSLYLCTISACMNISFMHSSNKTARHELMVTFWTRVYLQGLCVAISCRLC
jgi:hypothetical protein